jgi:hypothetical protein
MRIEVCAGSAIAMVIALGGCTASSAPAPTPTSTPTKSSQSATPSPSPTIEPSGSLRGAVVAKATCPQTDQQLAALPQQPNRAVSVTAVTTLLICAQTPIDARRDRLLRPTDPRFPIAMALLSQPSQTQPACTDASDVGVARMFVFASTTAHAYLVWVPTDPCGKPLGSLP